MSEKRYQVFISSTFTDLLEERQAALMAVLRMNHMPAGMELFPAANADAWNLIKGVIDSSDYYVVLIAGRYGSVDEAGVSYTEKEYDYAIRIGRPVLPLLHSAPDELPRSRTDRSDSAWERLTAFREKVESAHTCAYWKTASELQSELMAALLRTVSTTPGTGWVRADSESDSAASQTLALREQITQFAAELRELRPAETRIHVDRLLDEARDLMANQEGARHMLARQVRDDDALRRLELARRKLSEAYARDPGYWRTHSTQANWLVFHGRREDAEKAYRKAIELDDTAATAWNGLGNMLRTSGLAKDAEQAFRRAIKLDPNEAPPLNGLGNALTDLGKSEEAIEMYRRAIDLEPQMVAPWNGLGRVLTEVGRLAEAEEALKRAVELDAGSTSCIDLGILLSRAGRHGEAKDAFRKALSIEPGECGAWNGLGNALFQLGRHDEAESAYRKAIGCDAEDAVPWNGLGNALVELSRLQEAEEAYRTAISLDEHDCLPWGNLEILLRKSKRTEDADAARRRYEELLEKG